MKRRRRIGLALLGLGVGLAISEGVFRSRDHAAFPHLNVYEADPALGARLRPNATEELAFNGNPLTHVRIGPEGFRGAGLPPVTNDELIVVGDSQVFGLGVQEDETFSAVLSGTLGGRTVINAGVPTYGPDEYYAVTKSLLEKRHPGAARTEAAKEPLTVVYVINMANDLFEASRPNVTRHVVWDGWAVRKETAPDHLTSFPGRDWLYRDSHLFYALRGVGVAANPGSGFASEGSWKDLASLAHDDQKSDGAAVFAADRKKVEDAAREAQLNMEKALAERHPNVVYDVRGQAYLRGHGAPEDIVTSTKVFVSAEEARAVEVTANQLIAGADVRHEIEDRIQKEVARERARTQGDQTLVASFQERTEQQRKLEALLAAPLQSVRESSPMAPHIMKMKELADAHGARLLVVALPLDVQVSADEWKKYGLATAPIDVASTRVLSEDILVLSRTHGISALDPREALLAAEPGAFLIGDLHMTPKGHHALASAIATALHEPAQVTDLPLPLPAGRTRPPSEEEWKRGLHVVIDRPVLEDRLLYECPLDCRVTTLREWVRMVCVTDKQSVDPYYLEFRAPKPAAITAKRAGRDAMTMSGPGFLTATVPVVDGDSAVLTVTFESGYGDVTLRRKDGLLTLGWKRSDSPMGRDYEDDWTTFSKRIPRHAPVLTDGVTETCACRAAVTKGAACETFPGAPDADCARTYALDCEKRLRCEAGDPFTAPSCLPGWRHAGALEHCFQVCSPETPCKVGACTPYQGVSICM